MRLCVWTGVEEWLAEAATVDLRAGGMTATGTQLGAHPGGDPPGGAWDGERPDLSEALDIDVGFSPLTNSMPILRQGLHREGSRNSSWPGSRSPNSR